MSDHLEQHEQKLLNRFKELDQQIFHYREIASLVEWDMQTGAPNKGKTLRSEALGTLSAQLFERSTSTEMGEIVQALSSPDIHQKLAPAEQATVRLRKREYERLNTIPPNLYKEFVIHTSNAQQIWQEAKQTNNFSLYLPALEKIVDYIQTFIPYYQYQGHPYNALLDDYEPGLTVEKLDPLFDELRQKTIALLQKIQHSPFQPKKEIFSQHFPISKQKEFSLMILPQLGYDLEAGRLDESAHPFAVGMNSNDVRITTRYLEHDVRSALFGTIHECGHALYEQGIDPAYNGTSIGTGTSMGIHESQSLFWETIIGRSTPFWKRFYPELQKHFPEQFGSVSLEEFIPAINLVEPSLIRVDADELTYNLHIMLRYELEKGIIDGQIKVADLPQLWNEKMKDYLGVVPPDDKQGVLQDIHWAFGGFGYFPSYALGNLYAAQFRAKILQDLPRFYQWIEEGHFAPIRQWLREQIHQHGSLYTPDQLIKKVTGEELNASYLIHYLEEKYTQIYKLNL